MSRTSLLSPLRTFICPRPAIQAWRSARCFATEVSPVSTATLSNNLTASTSPSLTADQSNILSDNIVPAQIENATTLAVLEQKSENASQRKRSLVGVVVSAGKMQKTVKVRIPGQKFNKHLRKYFREDTDHLVHDPNTSLNIGDVVSLAPHRAAKHVHHMVSEILVPFGAPIADRAPVPSEAERKAEYEAKRAEKLERRSLRRAAAQGSERAIEALKAMGLDPGQGAEAGVGEKNAKKGGVLGKKGQKLPGGVLPGGLHAVGKIDARAKANKEKTMKRNEKAEGNLLEAKKVAEEVRA